MHILRANELQNQFPGQNLYGLNCKVRFQFARLSSSLSKFAKESAENKYVRQKLVLQKSLGIAELLAPLTQRLAKGFRVGNHEKASVSPFAQIY